MPKVVSNPSAKTIANRRWREKTADRYNKYKISLALWYKVSREFLKILDEDSTRKPVGRPRKNL
jgi:hypothetical protein